MTKSQIMENKYQANTSQKKDCEITFIFDKIDVKPQTITPLLEKSNS